MKLRVIDFGLTTPLRSQAVYHGLAETIDDGSDAILSLVSPDVPYVCVGRHQEIAREVDEDFCAKEGLPVIRVANNGVSAVIDGKGRILQSLPLNARGVIETGLPPALPPTFSARFGDLFFLFAEICGFLLIAFRRNLRRYSTI